MEDPLVQSHSAEAVQATAVAQEAIEKARTSQLNAAISRGLEEYFESRSSKRFIDINRIPFICDDIKGIHEKINAMGSDLQWMKWIGMGFVSAAGLLALKTLGI